MKDALALRAPAGSPVARSRRIWRIVFVLAIVVVTTATHWPKLQVGVAGHPIDKLLHATSFAGIALLLWRTRWMSTLLTVWFAVLLWCVVDELTQSIPGLGRSTDLDDWLADAIGVTLMVLVLGALRPMGRGVSLLLSRRRAVSIERLFARPTNWLHFIAVAPIAFAGGATAAVWFDSLLVRKPPQPWEFGFVGGVLGLGVACHLLLEFGVRHARRRAAAARACLHCGSDAAAPDTPSAPDAPAPATPCACCGEARRASDWAPTADLASGEAVRLCLVPTLVGLVSLFVVEFGVLFLLTAARLDWPRVQRLDLTFRRLPGDMRLLIDATALALAATWILWWCRRRIARRIDAGGERCLACGFDLHATAARGGGGACPECGAPFLRL
ncbi:MAG: VanZ family protein [Phycisphaerales bacterium]